MSKKPETLFKEKVIRELRQIPDLWFTKIQQVTRRGDPDLIICYKGHFFAFELKREAGAKIDELQQYTLDKIKKAGGHAFVVHPQNLYMILNILRKIN